MKKFFQQLIRLDTRLHTGSQFVTTTRSTHGRRELTRDFRHVEISSLRRYQCRVDETRALGPPPKDNEVVRSSCQLVRNIMQ